MPWTWSKYDRASLARFVCSNAAQHVLPLEPSAQQSAADPTSRKQLLETLYSALAKRRVSYSHELYTLNQSIQQIRAPNEVLNLFRQGTCLDLSLLFAGICLHFELLPLIIILDGHAYVMVSIYHGLRDWDSLSRSEYAQFSQGPVSDVRQLRTLVEQNLYLPIECTGFATPPATKGAPFDDAMILRNDLSFADAIATARNNLDLKDTPFLYAIDPAIARHMWGIPEAPNPDAPRYLPVGYTDRFVRQFENIHYRSREVPITEAIFRADLKTHYVPVGYIDSSGAYHDSLDDFLSRWCDTPGTRYLAVLGDYGTGKTSTLLHLTYRLLCACRASFYRSPLPIYMTFRDLNGNRAPVEQFCHLLRERYQITINSITDFEDFAHAYNVLLIMDGLDEITSSLDSALIKKRLNALSDLMVVCTKTLISARSAFFPSRSDAEHVLPMKAPEVSLLETYIPDCSFDVVIVADLDSSKQEAYLTKVSKSPESGQRLHGLIQSTYSLSQLARRPILLTMIERSLALSRNLDILELSPASLYDRYVDAYLTKEFLERRSNLKVEDKRRILRNLAEMLFRKGSTSLSRLDLATFLSDEPRASTSLNIELEELEYDFVACSFLTVTADGVFGFSHRSFLEFFIAESVVENVGSGRLGAISELALSPVIIRFFVDLVAARDLTIAMTATLEAWLPQPVGPTTSITTRNIISILCRLNYPFFKHHFSSVDLSYMDLSGGDFRGCRLQASDLSGTNLTDARFSSALLTGASLRNAFLYRTCFRDADLRFADFWNIRMVDGPTTVLAAGFVPHSSLAAIGTSDGDLVICRVSETTSSVASVVRVSETGILHFAFTPDGARLAISDRSARVYLYDLGDLSTGNARPKLIIGDQTDNVRWLEFSPSAHCLACATREGTVRLWTFGLRNDLVEFRSHDGPVMCARWSPNGRLLASAGYDGRVFLLSAASNGRPILIERTGEGRAHAGIVRALAFSTDGRLLGSAGEDGKVNIWAIREDRSFDFCQALNIDSPVFALLFLDTSTFVFGTHDGRIGMANAETGTVTRIISGHADIVRSIDSNNSGLLLTASWDGTTRLWTLPNMDPYQEVYRVKQGGIRGAGSFAGSQIAGLKGLSHHWLRFFVVCGARPEQPHDMTAQDESADL